MARGGWAAAAWLARGRRDTAVTLLVVAPDGRQTRTVIERAPSDFVNWPQVGIGPAGEVTVLWSRIDRRSSQLRLRLARVSPGGPPVVSDLPGVLSPRHSGAPGALAVAPNGATLLAWAAEDGVRVQEGAGDPVLVSPSVGASSVTAAINDAGAALLAHGTSAGEVVLLDRAARPPLAVPARARRRRPRPVRLRLRRNHPHPRQRARARRTRGRRLDGHARRTFSRRRGRRLGGGSWSGPASLSAITRDGLAPSLFLDARGEPRVLWSERGAGARGARLAPAVSDTTPPVVTARLPARIRLAASGRFRLAVSVHCSEACDARLSVRGTGPARALPAGRTTTLRYRAPAELARELRLHPRSRRLRVRLVVTDRAGNAVRSSRVVHARMR